MAFRGLERVAGLQMAKTIDSVIYKSVLSEELFGPTEATQAQFARLMQNKKQEARIDILCAGLNKRPTPQQLGTFTVPELYIDQTLTRQLKEALAYYSRQVIGEQGIFVGMLAGNTALNRKGETSFYIFAYADQQLAGAYAQQNGLEILGAIWLQTDVRMVVQDQYALQITVSSQQKRAAAFKNSGGNYSNIKDAVVVDSIAFME